MILLITGSGLFLLYALLILYYRRAWIAASLYLDEPENLITRITVVVPARNEEDNIGNLLSALEKQTYPRELFEIIVVDDDSTDKTAAIVQQFKNVKLIPRQKGNIAAYKKKAIETGIEVARGDWILTTDADCLPPSGWLSTIASFIQKKDTVMVVAPVVYEKKKSLLDIFQSLDFLALQGITGGRSHTLCNGANLAYKKTVFNEVGGFGGIDELASGDDLLLMQKVKKVYPDKIFYLKSKEAIVSTRPPQSWKEFIRQRVRWASKSGAYTDKKMIASLALVFFLDLDFLVLLVAGFFCIQYWVYFLGLWVLKSLVEYSFMIPVTNFFGRRYLLPWFFFLQPLHIIYIVFIGIRSRFGSYIWKGRRVK
jgi:poly-beta-1,6-N-acetyl-D-glucosamine synthase